MTRFQTALVTSLVCLGTTACSNSSVGDEATELATQLSATAALSPVCGLLTRAEVRGALGRPVQAGINWGPLGSGCHWAAQDDGARGVTVQVVPREYWEDGARQPGGRVLAGIGEKAFIGPWLDEQRAGVLVANGAVYVMAPSSETAVALLRDLVTRIPPP